MASQKTKVILALPGLALALLAALSVPALPNILRATVKRHWLYSVDAAPLDHRYLAICLAAIAISLAFSALLLRRQLKDIGPRRIAIAASLFFALLVPLKNGSAEKCLFFCLALPGVLALWRASLPWQGKTAGLLDRAFGTAMAIPPNKWRALVLALGLAANLLAALLLLDAMPRVIDGVDYLFQARIFARGEIWAPAAEPAEFFHFLNLINRDGRWISQYPPGWPALLSLGVLARAPWAANPLLGAFAALLIYELGRDVFGESTGRVASVLAAASPYMIGMNASFMSHPSCGMFVVAFAYLLHKSLAKKSAALAFAATFCLGLAACVRPYSAFLAGLPGAGLVLFDLARRPRETAPIAVAAALGPALPLALLLYYNHLATGSALVFGYKDLYGDTLALGFGPRQFPYPHTPAEGLRLFHSRLLALSRNAFYSPVPALFIAGLAFVLEKPGRASIWLGLTFIALPAGYVLYFFQDFFYEPRFLFETSGIFAVLCGRGLVLAYRRWAGRDGAAHFIATAALATLLLFVPAGLAGLARQGDIDDSLREMIEAAEPGRAIIFVEPLYYPMGMALQSPFLDGDIIYVRDLGDGREELMSRYPGRAAYRFHREEGKFALRRLSAVPGD